MVWIEIKRTTAVPISKNIHESCLRCMGEIGLKVTAMTERIQTHPDFLIFAAWKAAKIETAQTTKRNIV